MSYTPKQLYLDLPAMSGSIANLDNYISYFSSFLSAAGWTVTEVPALSTASTTADMVDADFMTEGNKGAWQVTNVQTGDYRYVVNTLKPAFSYLAPISYVTGTMERSVVHAYILIAISDIMPGAKLTGLTSTQTRIQLDTSSNNAGLTFGNSLQTVITPADFGFGGRLCKCAPSKRKVFKSGVGVVEYGASNYLTLYIYVNRGHTTDISVTCAKDYTGDHPSLMPVALSGSGYMINETSYQSLAGQLGGSLSGGTFRTIAFANKHQVIAQCFNASNVAQDPNIAAGALKLIDLRRAYSDDLPITIATHFSCQKATSSLYNNLASAGNGKRYVINGLASHDVTSNFQGQLAVETSDVAPQNVNHPWDNGPFEVSEAWYGYAINSSPSIVPIVGQLHDALILNEPSKNSAGTILIDPFTAPEFTADGQNWKRASTTEYATLCLRKSGTYNHLTGLIT